MNNRSRLWIISEEMSISRLTKPGPQMSEGILRSEWVGATCISIGVVARAGWAVAAYSLNRS